MHDHKHGGDDRHGSRHEHHGNDCCGGRDGGGERHRDGERRGDRSAPHGDGQDTRFLQLEMSQVLYAEAESLTRQAFRDLLLEAAKGRMRERFGDKITGLAQLAVDELMGDVMASLDIEARIRQRNREQGRTKDRLRDIFAAPESGSSRREGEGGADEGGPDRGPKEDR